MHCITVVWSQEGKSFCVTFPKHASESAIKAFVKQLAFIGYEPDIFTIVPKVVKLDPNTLYEIGPWDQVRKAKE